MSNSGIRYGVLTVSDRCSRGLAEDKSGDELCRLIQTECTNAVVTKRLCVPDELPAIQVVLMQWCDSDEVDILLTTGGTGFAVRDVTPEATKLVLDKDAPGMVIAMIQGSLAVTPLAMLSRPACGIRKNTVIVNLPGSVKGSTENFRFIQKQLGHAVDLIRNSLAEVENVHSTMASGQQLESKVNATNVADRLRKSKYPMLLVEKAQEIIMQQTNGFKQEKMKVNLKQGLGFVLGENIFAKDPLPPFPASIKDGYAVKVTDRMDLLQVAGDSTAGESPDKIQVQEGFCVRVNTGAPVPLGADAVIQVEDTELAERTADGNDEKVIRILSQPVVGQDIRSPGSDIQVNEKVAEEGTKLSPADLGILATVGVYEFWVYRKPVVAVLSTGNELQTSGGPLGVGKIRDSNKTIFEALFAQDGFQTVDLGIAQDTPQSVLDKLIEGFRQADIVVSSGGVSMGERDYLKRVLEEDLNATIHFGSVCMKPGKPTTFATCDFNGKKKFIFGLPGNPSSATVTSYLFVLPFCRKLAGWEFPFFTTVRSKAETAMRLTDNARPEYHRVTLTWGTDDNIPMARSTGNQISSRLTSFNSANAFYILPLQTKERKEIPAGTVCPTLIVG